MTDQPYLNREIDEKFTDIKDALIRIEVQTTKTNGTVKMHAKALLVVGSVVATLLLVNGSDLLAFLLAII